MTDKTFMGRVFLPPAPSQELHINIGWHFANAQTYPEWMPIFEEAISKAEYDALIGKIKGYLEKNKVDAGLPLCGMFTVCCFGIGCCILGYVASKASQITNDLKKIAEEHSGARIELVQYAPATARTAETMGVDQYGQPCIAGGSGRRRGPAQTRPVWPPLGYNIVLKAPASFDLRSVWPKPTDIASSIQVPTATTTGVPVTASVAVAPDPAPIAEVIVRETPAAERLKTAEKLRDDGMITEDEFQAKRKAILDEV